MRLSCEGSDEGPRIAHAPLIVSYTAGDGATFSADVVVPVAAESKEALIDAFDTAMAAYEPGGNEFFSIFDQVFEYRHFVYWGGKPGSLSKTYDCVRPEIRTVEEWSAACRSRSNSIIANHPHAVFEVPIGSYQSSVPRA